MHVQARGLISLFAKKLKCMCSNYLNIYIYAHRLNHTYFHVILTFTFILMVPSLGQWARDATNSSNTVLQLRLMMSLNWSLLLVPSLKVLLSISSGSTTNMSRRVGTLTTSELNL